MSARNVSHTSNSLESHVPAEDRLRISLETTHKRRGEMLQNRQAQTTDTRCTQFN